MLDRHFHGKTTANFSVINLQWLDLGFAFCNRDMIIRTTGNPFRNRPSRLLAATVALTTLVGVALPFTPLRGPLGFVIPSAPYLLFVAVATIAYLGAVEIAKRRLVPRLLA